MVEKIEKKSVAGIVSFGNNVKPLSQETPGIGAMAELTTNEIEKFR